MRYHYEPVQATTVDDRGAYGRLRRHAWGQWWLGVAELSANGL